MTPKRKKRSMKLRSNKKKKSIKKSIRTNKKKKKSIISDGKNIDKKIEKQEKLISVISYYINDIRNIEKKIQAYENELVKKSIKKPKKSIPRKKRELRKTNIDFNLSLLKPNYTKLPRTIEEELKNPKRFSQIIGPHFDYTSTESMVSIDSIDDDNDEIRYTTEPPKSAVKYVPSKESALKFKKDSVKTPSKNNLSNEEKQITESAYIRKRASELGKSPRTTKMIVKEYKEYEEGSENPSKKLFQEEPEMDDRTKRRYQRELKKQKLSPIQEEEENDSFE